MTADPTKINFYSGFPIDKITAYSSTTGSSPSSVPVNISYSIAGDPTNGVFVIESIANPYGKKCLTNLSWSVDGINYYDQDAQLQYYNASQHLNLTQMQVQCGCSDANIYFSFTSFYTSTQTVYLQFAIDSIT
jgi:hypothetical protein